MARKIARKITSECGCPVCLSRECVSVQSKSRETLINSRSTLTQKLAALARESTRKGSSFDWPYTSIKAPYLLSPNYYDSSSSAFQLLPDFACVKRKGENLGDMGNRAEAIVCFAYQTCTNVFLFFLMQYFSLFF
jgi:hypothetical protein